MLASKHPFTDSEIHYKVVWVQFRS